MKKLKMRRHPRDGLSMPLCCCLWMLWFMPDVVMDLGAPKDGFLVVGLHILFGMILISPLVRNIVMLWKKEDTN